MRQSIDEFTKYIHNLHRETYAAREMRNELSRALTFVEESATFTNTKKPLTEDNDLCAICHEQMTNSDSTKLTECNHAFHLKCIKRWFHKKNTISCPCCRTICNKDNYFVLNKFVWYALDIYLYRPNFAKTYLLLFPLYICDFGIHNFHL